MAQLNFQRQSQGSGNNTAGFWLNNHMQLFGNFNFAEHSSGLDASYSFTFYFLYTFYKTRYKLSVKILVCTNIYFCFSVFSICSACILWSFSIQNLQLADLNI